MKRLCQSIRSSALAAGLGLLAVGSAPLMAQLAVVSTSIEHGQVNVPTSISIDITFSLPLAPAGSLELDPGDLADFVNIGDLLDLGSGILPIDPVSDDCAPMPAAVAVFVDPEFCPGGSSLSTDGKTVTFTDVTLLPDTRHNLLVLEALSLTGEILDQPTVVTFTTGSTLPEGEVSGVLEEITEGEDPTPGGTLVVLVAPDQIVASASANSDSEAPVDLLLGVADSDGFYAVDFVPDGVYFVYAFDLYQVLVEAFEGETDPGTLLERLPAGGYDRDDDRILDTVEISGGSAVGSVEFETRTGRGTLARDLLVPLQVAASEISPAAYPAVAAGLGLAPTGEAAVWAYYFFAPDTALVALTLGHQAFPPFGISQEDALPLPPLGSGWEDSDQAVTFAREFGAAPFLDEHPASIGVALLIDRQFFELLMAALSSGELDGLLFEAAGKRQSVATPLGLIETIRSGIGATPSAKRSNALEGAAWIVAFADPEGATFMVVAVDAQTGEGLMIVAPSYARENAAAAAAAASLWSDDAVLVAISTDGMPFSDSGESVMWTYTYYSAAKDSASAFLMSYGHVFAWLEADATELASLDALPDEWIDSDVAMSVVSDHKPGFRDMLADPSLDLRLSRGVDPGDPDRAMWQLTVEGLDAEQSLQTINMQVDALSSVFVANEPNGELPGRFVLEQNYPNPFNPSTIISYQTPNAATVRLSVHDVLGREVAVLIDGRVEAGHHRVQWAPANGVLASGVYLCRLSVDGTTLTRSMVYQR